MAEDADMGVNHGGGRIPQNLQWGDDNTGCPPRFLSFFKISSARHTFVPPPRFQPRSTPLDAEIVITCTCLLAASLGDVATI
jgi:hypothetical protein